MSYSNTRETNAPARRAALIAALMGRPGPHPDRATPVTARERGDLLRALRGQSSIPAKLQWLLSADDIERSTNDDQAPRGLLDMSRPEDRQQAAAILAEHGRDGDTLVAHINPEEARRLREMGGRGTVNPKTGILEFADMDGQGTTESGAVGAGVSDNPGYGTTDTFGGAAPGAGAMLGEDRAQAPNIGDFGPAMDPGGRDEGDRGRAAGRAGGIGAFNDSRTALDRIGDFISGRIENARANPFATALNMAFSTVPVLGTFNTVSGLLGGRTVGDITTAAARGVTGYTSAPGGLLDTATNPGGSKDSPLDPNGQNDTRGGSDASHSLASGTGGPLSQQTASDVARGALARALVGTPDNLNRWDGNKFVPGSNAGAPNGYNSWNGNQFRTPGGMTYGPGLVSSFDPNGRQYVTRWGYTG